MILYCEFLSKDNLTDCDPKGADYQIIYSNFGVGKEQFSMNFLNKLTGKYQYVKRGTKIYRKGLDHARYSWKRDKKVINKITSNLHKMSI